MTLAETIFAHAIAKEIPRGALEDGDLMLFAREARHAAEVFEKTAPAWRCPHGHGASLADDGEFHLCETCNAWYRGDERIVGAPPRQSEAEQSHA